MKSLLLAAGLMGAMIAQPARAADLGDTGPPPPPRSGAYDAPRFIPNAPRSPLSGYDEEEYDDRLPPAWKKYSASPPHGRTCARSEEVRQHLTSFGWHDFHAGQQQGELVTMRARRPGGRLFELTLHRCSGEIVEVQPLEPRRFGPFAYRERLWLNGPHGFDGPHGHGLHLWWHLEH